MEETESDENRRSALKNPDMMGEHTEFITRLFFKSSDKESTLYQLFNHFVKSAFNEARSQADTFIGQS